MNNDKDISGCKIAAVENIYSLCSDPTYLTDCFVYVYDDSSLEKDIIYMSELDEKGVNDFKPDCLKYSVSLRELVLAAKKAGILDKLAKKTRFTPLG